MKVIFPDFKISLRANNQVTITRQNVIKRGKTYERLSQVKKISSAQVDRYCQRISDYSDVSLKYSHTLKHLYLDTPKRPFPLPLDLTNRFQHTKTDRVSKRLGYGEPPKIKYFSRLAGQKIRETGAIIDGLCGSQLDRCRVVTLTLPSSDERAYTVLSNYSAYIPNRIFQIIRRDYSLSNWFYVWEHQKRGALHLHICVYHESPCISKEIGDKLCSKWYEILGDLSTKTGINLLFSRGFNRTCLQKDVQLDNQAMRLGCGAYFSKYASKNSGKHSDDINSVNARKYPVSSFWGRSRDLRRQCETQSYLFRYEGIDNNESESMRNEAFELLSQMNIVYHHSFHFKKEVSLKDRTKEDTLTICEGESSVFYLSPKDYRIFLENCREHFDNYKGINSLDKRKQSPLLEPVT